MKQLIKNLDSIVVGDKICDDVSDKYFKIIGVSEHFLIGIQTIFDTSYYTVYSKTKADYTITMRSNYISRIEGEFYRGDDDKSFGHDIDITKNITEQKVNTTLCAHRGAK